MDWAEVRRALEELLDAPPDERDARLAELTRRDPLLGLEVAALLEHDRAADASGRFLEPTEAARAAPPAAPPGGRRIGPYELLRELGRGGMGVVYLARRADGAFERRVAIKVIQRDLADALVLERFLRERQVLANLQHPGIARLIEGGTTEDGAPYLVMEYVEGIPVDRYCDAERLPVRARLELFLAVCEAVQHAHENLVVHRDLKPRNVLVGARGEPVLLDFGIAKVLDPEKTSAAPEVTVGVQRFLTPAYASPEQVAGRPITTASDVYSLGVVLFHLLTGELPYRFETTSAAEIERVVCEAEARRPSAAVLELDPAVAPTVAQAVAEERARARGTTPRALARALAGDLDRIVLKALRKEARQRYPSAERLADDLRRHLEGRPVTARPDTFAYRASRLVRRHRAAVGAVAAVLLALVAGLVLSTTQYVRAESVGAAEREQRELAEARLAESQRLARDLAAERSAARERLVEVEWLNDELEQQRALAERRLEDVRGFATDMIFELHAELYGVEGATPAREKLVATGLAYLDRLAAESQGDVQLQRQLAHAYQKLAGILGAFGEANVGRLAEALECADKAVAIADALRAADPDDVGHAALAAQTLGVRANLLFAAGHEDRGLEGYRAADEAGRRVARSPAATREQLFIARVCTVRLAEALMIREDFAEALELFRSTEAHLLDALERWPDLDLAAELGVVRIGLGRCEYAVGERQRGVALLADAVAELERLIGRAPRDAIVVRRAWLARTWLADVLTQEGRLEEAAALLEANAAELRRALEADPENAQTPLDLLTETQRLIRVRFMSSDWRAALDLAEGVLDLARAQPAHNPRNAHTWLLLAGVLTDLGASQHRLGLPVEAGRNLGEACEVLERLVAGDPSQLAARRYLARAYTELGRAHCATGRDGDAEVRRRSLAGAAAWFERALEAMEALERDGVPAAEQRYDEVAAERDACRDELEALGSPPD